jgi:hypothetical protein
MDAHALTIKTVRDGPVCTLILRGDLDLLEAGGFLEQADLPEPSLGHGLRDGPRDSRTGQQDFAPVELGAPFLAGTEGCP